MVEIGSSSPSSFLKPFTACKKRFCEHVTLPGNPREFTTALGNSNVADSWALSSTMPMLISSLPFISSASLVHLHKISLTSENLIFEFKFLAEYKMGMEVIMVLKYFSLSLLCLSLRAFASWITNSLRVCWHWHNVRSTYSNSLLWDVDV